MAIDPGLVELRATPPLSPGRAWYGVAVLAFVYALSYADRMLMSLLILPIKADLALSDTQVSLLIGFAFASVYALLGLPCGYLADRLNRRNFIALGVGGWSAMTGLCGLAGGFGTLFLTRMGVGMGEAVLSPSAYSMLSDSFERERLGRANAVYTIAIPVGTGLAMVFGGVVVQAISATPSIDLPIVGEMASWRAAFVVMGLIGLAFVPLLLTLREPPRKAAPPLAGASAAPPGLFAFLRRERRFFLLFLAGICLLSMMGYGTIAWTPVFFQRTYGVEVGRAGIWFGLVLAFAGPIGLLSGGLIGDRLCRRGRPDGHLLTLAAGMAIAAPFYLLVPLSETPAWAIALLIPATLAWSTVNSLASTIVQLVTPPEMRGRMTGFYFLVGNLSGLGLGPTLVALLTDRVFGEAGLRWSLMVVAAALPLSAYLFWRAAPHLRRALAPGAGG